VQRGDWLHIIKKRSPVPFCLKATLIPEEGSEIRGVSVHCEGEYVALTFTEIVDLYAVMVV
jgi:hypothetical protein